MSVKKFKFVSPGVFINEIDNSQLPATPVDVGPVVIGRFPRGPAMVPVQVDSFSDFITVFGEPQPGGQGGDVWRDGNKLAPTYGAYAAQAWLRNSSPLNVVRLLGTQDADATTAGEAGWTTDGQLTRLAGNAQSETVTYPLAEGQTSGENEVVIGKRKGKIPCDICGEGVHTVVCIMCEPDSEF